MENKINKLTDPATFWEDVRQIVGYYDDSIFLEDWQIKHLQRVADARYNEITK